MHKSVLDSSVFSTEFALKSDRHSGCFPRNALRRFFKVLFLGHTFIVSGQFPEVPVFSLNWYGHVRRGVSPLRQLNQGTHSGIVS